MLRARSKSVQLKVIHLKSDEATNEPINEPKMKKPKIRTSMTVHRSMTSLPKVSIQKPSWMSSDKSPKPPQKAQSSSKLPQSSPIQLAPESLLSNPNSLSLSSYYYSSSEEESIATESTPPHKLVNLQQDTLSLKVKVPADDSISTT